MGKITRESLANLRFELRWENVQAVHSEVYEAQGVNMWRDRLPETLMGELEGRAAGEVITIDFKAGDIVPAYVPGETLDIKENQFDRNFAPDRTIEPRSGRFYPKGLLRGIAGVFPQNFHPFRLVEIRNGGLRADFNHPLAKTDLRLRTTIKQIGDGRAERGGRSHDWAEIISEGPGMQARWKNTPTEFFSDNPFRRTDNRPDPVFYEQPRLVQHIDDTAIRVVSELYGRLLKSGMRVLDLMSSWQSHIPDDMGLEKLTGLGLNMEELEKNTALNDRLVHDLNATPILPFESDEFDAVICTVSIEYLIDPDTVFDEIARVLKPEGVLIVTFSNRWFPPKVIRIWEELHDFERMGLVLEYFQRNGKFKSLETFSVRGLPRPWDDRYFPAKRYSDPIYAVWGRKRIVPND